MFGRNILMGTTRTQRFWGFLHDLSLRGMSIGAGSLVGDSGERAVLEQLQQSATRDRELTVLDVGANEGDYALAALHVLGDRARIHCFEPSPTAFEALERRIRANENITLVNMGMSDAVGERVMYADRPGSPLGSLYERQLDHLDISVAPTETVQLTTVDEYVQSNEIERVDLLKLDVEGHELDVLRGASSLLDSGRIGLIQFEFGGTNIDSRTFLRDFYELLQPRYELHRIVADGIEPLGRYRETSEIFATTNYLAVPVGRGLAQHAA